MFTHKGKLTHGTGVLFPFHENAIVSRRNRINFTGDVVFMMDALLLLVRRSDLYIKAERELPHGTGVLLPFREPLVSRRNRINVYVAFSNAINLLLR